MRPPPDGIEQWSISPYGPGLVEVAPRALTQTQEEFEPVNSRLVKRKQSSPPPKIRIKPFPVFQESKCRSLSVIVFPSVAAMKTPKPVVALIVIVGLSVEEAP